MFFQIEPDPWLSSIMERPAYVLKKLKSGEVGVSGTVSKLAIDGAFTTAKVPAEDIIQTNKLIEMGFRVVDCALIFEMNAECSKESTSIRIAFARDESRVREIASNSFRFSRFHSDPMISMSLANKIKAEWAGNFFNGLRGDAMLIAEVDGVVAGFCQLIIRDSRAIIDLIAIDASCSRRGLARSLLASITGCVAKMGRPVNRIVVGTQSANVPSVNLYESFGFRLIGSNFVLHRSSSLED